MSDPYLCDQCERKIRCQNSLKTFLEEYFPHEFSMPWTKDQLAAIRKIQSLAKRNVRAAQDMPFGKTTMLIGAVLWLLLFRHRKSVLLVSDTSSSARDLFQIIRNQREFSPVDDDFPSKQGHISVAGLRSNLQGITRPDAILFDDPYPEGSDVQVAKRMKAVNKILRIGGGRLPVFAAVTCRRPNDLASQIKERLKGQSRTVVK